MCQFLPTAFPTLLTLLCTILQLISWNLPACFKMCRLKINLKDAYLIHTCTAVNQAFCRYLCLLLWYMKVLLRTKGQTMIVIMASHFLPKKQQDGEILKNHWVIHNVSIREGKSANSWIYLLFEHLPLRFSVRVCFVFHLDHSSQECEQHPAVFNLRRNSYLFTTRSISVEFAWHFGDQTWKRSALCSTPICF